MRSAWELNGSQGQEPPLPLVLDGWHYSSDVDKQFRWRQVVDWAKRNGEHEALLDLKEEDCYYVSELSTSYPEQHYSFEYIEPRDRPTDAQIDTAFTTLLKNWTHIAGPEVSPYCVPHSITGRKARRLLVKLTGEGNPPWGSWFSLDSGPSRKRFTEFRQRINDAVKPA
ncbi:hypothetical protein, partial [Haloferula sp.]|uniref:hypothetical protein n=1 Tax=Haloferula sp. TaxID=2497595 RepID=UPI003C70DB34